MDIPIRRNALDDALRKYNAMYGDHGRGLSGKHVPLADKAIKVGHEMANKLWDEADKKSDELLGIKQLIEEYKPLYEGAEDYVVKNKLAGQLTEKEIKLRLDARRQALANSFAVEFAERAKEKKFYIKEMVYTHKEQVNKVYTLERAEKMADKQFLRQLAVATTKFLAVDGPGQITQALNDLVSLLFNDVVQNRREKD